MLKRKSALFLMLIANSILLVHSAKTHHHFDDSMLNNHTHQSSNKHSKQTHQHQHHNHSSENDPENPLNTPHEHDFPLHCHTVLTDFLIVKSTNQITLSKTIKKKDVFVFYHLKLDDIHNEFELKKDFKTDSNQLRSLFKPGTLLLRGPPIS